MKAYLSYPFVMKCLGYFYPDIVTVQSRNQETIDVHRSRLGDYLRERGRYSKGLPVWEQKDGDHVLSYNDQKEWEVSQKDWVDSQEGTTLAAGIKTSVTGLQRIPPSGWLTWHSNRWKNDAEMKVIGRLNFVSQSFKTF